jgi:phage shock protein PspC (stress-responsive transcriptional regulator)
MNKTLSVNIGGIVFHIEELAYDKLNRYLDAIKGYFTTSDGRDEIIQDIEGRIGEMFQERISVGKQVIVDSDVDQIIDLMGRPEQFAGMHEETATSEAQYTTSDRKAYRRLYRDPDDRVIGGVCSGLGHYLGLDPVWLRVAFAVSFFVFGTGLLLYIILMIVMPKAITTAEKLEMKGEKVNISNIRKSVEEEISSIKSNYSQPGGPSGIARFFDALGQILTGIFRLIGKIIAVFFIIIGMLILVSFALVFLAILGVGGITVPFFITDLFMDPWQQSMALLGAFMVIGIPLMMIIFKAVKVLFKIKVESRFLNWSAFALWVVGVILSITVISSIAKDFKIRETQRTEIPIMQPASDTLFLDSFSNDEYRDEWFYINNHRMNDPWGVVSEEDTIRIGDVKLDIIKSTTGKFELVQVASARGADRRQAVSNARSMIYQVEQTDSLIRFDETFQLPKGFKYRKQNLQLILKVPEGKSVYLGSGIDDVIYDIENVTNTYDGDMIGKTWTMTAKGLECVGCDLVDQSISDRQDQDINISINDHGVKVSGVDHQKDSDFVIDSKDVDININSEGVQIDAKTRKK